MFIKRFFAEWRNILRLEPGACDDEEIARLFPRHMLVNTFDLTFWLLGASFISITTILPVFARHFTDSAIVIGLIPALNDFGWFFPQLFLAPVVERLSRKYPLAMKLAFLERVPYLAFPLMAVWLVKLPRGTALAFFILLLAWKSVASGIVAIPWTELMAKLIPLSHRGRFFAVSHLVGQFVGIGGSAVAAWVLAKYPFPTNFAICFAVAAAALMISFGFFSQNREPERAPAPMNPANDTRYFKRLGSILRSNRNFRLYIINRWLAYMGTMAFGFVAVFCVEGFGFPDSSAAIFTAILYAASAVGYAVWGPLCDRLGNKRVMVMSAGLWLATLLALLLSIYTKMAWIAYLEFFLMGLSNSGGTLSDFNLAMELGPVEDRPTYVGLTRAVTGPALFVAPLLGGWIAQSISYTALFVTSFIFAGVGVIILAAFIKEPRTTHRGA